MAKFTFETDDAAEARSILDALETRGTSTAEFKSSTAAISTTPENRSDPNSPDDDILDANGMPWNADYHTDARTMKADGTWKARKGKTEEAKAAVAAHKAAGGNVTPPADIAAPATGGMPGATAAPATGGMPGATGGMPGATARAEDMPPPVSQEQLETKIMALIDAGRLSMDPTSAVGAAAANSYQGLLDMHGVNRADPTGATETNESLRAAIFNTCVQIETAA